MRILFYLPVVTPWWFDNIVVHLIRALAAEAEVHVLVAPLWRGTGIGPEQLAPCTDLEHVHFHILDGDDHPAIRTSAAGHPELIELVQAIDADYTLCRSADIAVPSSFPGRVLYLMEGGAAPLPTRVDWVVLQPTLFDQGSLPLLGPELRQRLDSGFARAWQSLRRAHAEANGAPSALPADRRILALPLEYEHEENFFRIHSEFASNRDLVASLAEALDDDFFLAVTNHPLNELHTDNRALYDLAASLPGRMAIVAGDGPHSATERLAQHCDGMIVGNSKCFAAAAFFGTPMLRRSAFGSGPWLNAHQDFGAFIAAVRSGDRRAAREEDALTWFAFHIANDVLDPTHADVDAAEIIDRLEKPVDPGRWDMGVERYRQFRPELFA